MSYTEDLIRAKDDVITVLKKKGVQARYLEFGGEGEQPKRNPRVPNDAKSEFLANRAMGDWAERIFAASIRKSQPGWQVTHYGDSDNKAAGDGGFKEFYLGLFGRSAQVRQAS